jgi:hypothetical protein
VDLEKVLAVVVEQILEPQQLPLIAAPDAP